ncbi:hypothetical protein BY996DRAFT_6595674 [Phakopsora pachyrhizi]|nr:hypothetical protein BY996DRAFT_6595674 [Phakopsora pachyrhizi]
MEAGSIKGQVIPQPVNTFVAGYGGLNFGGVGLPAAFNPFGGLLNQISACQNSLDARISS